MATRTVVESDILVQERRKSLGETYVGRWLMTTDHKMIGIMYIVTAFFFFLVGGLEALMIRTQLAVPNGKVLSPEQYDQVFTMHGVTMIFLFVMPILTGFGNYVVPLMIGARDMAFPRLNAFGYWVVLFGGVFLESSFLFGSAPNGGWFNYAPLNEVTGGLWQCCSVWYRYERRFLGAGYSAARYLVHFRRFELCGDYPQDACARHDD